MTDEFARNAINKRTILNDVTMLYTRTDIRDQMEIVNRQKGRSGAKYDWKKLNDMCKGYGVSPEQLSDKKQSARAWAKIPTIAHLENVLVQKLYWRYQQVMTPAKYMEGLVRRLGKEFQTEPVSVRMTILKQFVKYTDYYTEPVIAWAVSQMTEAEQKTYHQAEAVTKTEMVLAHLTESVFDCIQTEDMMGKRAFPTSQWRKFFLKRMKKEVSENFLKEEGACERRRWLEELESTADEERQHELLELLEDAYVNYLSLGRYGSAGEDSEHEESDEEYCKSEREVERYFQAKKDARRKKEQKYKLLKLADNLANGKFKVGGITRQELYLFAIAFHMTVCLPLYPEEERICDPDTDLEKNLFHDFYNDNMLRFIFDEKYNAHKSDYQKEPSGSGINYKNYVEMTYLYYLYRTDLRLSPREQMMEAQKVIDACVDRVSTKKQNLSLEKEHKNEKTAVYKNEHLRGLLRCSNQEELIHYLCTFYEIKGNASDTARILVSSEQKTAYSYYKELVKRIQTEETYLDSVSSMVIEDQGKRENRRRRRSDRKDMRAVNFIDQEIRKWIDQNEFDDSFQEFLLLLKKKTDQKMKKFLKADLENSSKKDRSVSRTDLLTAHYCVIRADAAEFEDLSVPELYAEFCEQIDSKLEESGFQKVDEKNIFDMFLIVLFILEVKCT